MGVSEGSEVPWLGPYGVIALSASDTFVITTPNACKTLMSNLISQSSRFSKYTLVALQFVGLSPTSIG